MPHILKALGGYFGQRQRVPAVAPRAEVRAALASVTGLHRFALDPAVTAKILGDQLILVQLRTGATFRLNRTGQLIWDLACAGHSHADIVQRLAAAFPGVPDRLPEDADQLLQELVRHQLLQPVGEGQS